MIHNDLFRTSAAAPPGTGLRSFARQVAGARALGVSYIEAYAAGSLRTPDWNGYYTWARFGYNADLYEEELLLLSTQSKFSGIADLNDLIRLPEGIAWWKRYGRGRNMTFDLSDGSKSLSILRDYLWEKGVYDVKPF